MPAPAVPDAILAALRRRGLALREDDHGGDTLAISGWPPQAVDLFYAAMQRYSFRLVLRDMIRLSHQGSFAADALTRHVSLEAVRAHLHTLLELGVCAEAGDGFRLAVQAESLGPTLEWFVAELLRRELGFCVGRGIPLRGGQTGGDLDVVGLAEGKLLLCEVKSGPPKHLTAEQIGAFLDRVQALAPQGAIFFEDTELRMADKVVVLFEQVLAARGLRRRPERLQRELFTVGEGIYIANAYPEVVGNLVCCVSHLLRAQGLQL
jgi:hypothetical protein